jgi:hypothetical protein
MPRDASPIEVIGLVELVERLGQQVKISELVHRFQRQNRSSLSALEAACGLDLMNRNEKFVYITDLGLGFLRASDGKMGIIRAELCKIEPFKSALYLLTKKSSVSVHEVTKSLGERKLWEQSSEENDSVAKLLLIEWGITSDLLSYNGKNQQFRLA